MGIAYKKTKGYYTDEDKTIETGIIPEIEVDTEFLKLDLAGKLYIRRYYNWDGLSCSPDFKTGLYGSLVHDCFYQMFRCSLLDMKYRKAADKLFRALCLKSGMSNWLAYSCYRAVRTFGKKAAKPRPIKDKRKVAP